MKSNIKIKYRDTYEDIWNKRFISKNNLRNIVHQMEYFSIFKYLNPHDRLVLDLGCGDGVFSIIAVKKGFKLVSCDISHKNIINAYKYSKKFNVNNGISFIVADLEYLPFKNSKFTRIVNLHVLEHLYNINKGLREIFRICKDISIIAIPTNCNPCSWVILGGGPFWYFSILSFFHLIKGLLKFILYLKKDGIYESYRGSEEIYLPHLWHYPWKFEKKVIPNGFKLIKYEASSIFLPFIQIPFILKLFIKFNKLKNRFPFNLFGYGTIYIFKKIKNKS
ncbi:MAG: class I SAM-dependent methyltransferase [Candidatus Helarchaeota archaeon]